MSITQSSTFSVVGTYSMKIETAGAELLTNLANTPFADVRGERFVCVSAFLHIASNPSGNFTCRVAAYNSAKTYLGTIEWATKEKATTDFIRIYKSFDMSKLGEAGELPTGTAYVRLQFGFTSSPTGTAYVDAVKVEGGRRPSAISVKYMNEHTTLDEVNDGTTYKRVHYKAVTSSGYIDLAGLGIVGRGKLALLSEVTNKEIAKNAVTDATILDGAVTANKIGTYAVTNTKIASNAVTYLKIASSTSNLTRATGGLMTAALSTITLAASKILDLRSGKTKIKTFTSMPTQSDVEDGEWFGVTGGTTPGIYVRSGSVAMNGVGEEEALPTS